MPKIKALIKDGEYEEILAAVQSPVITLTELIKNASDSCLNNEHPIIIRIDTQKEEIVIEDSGTGFSEEDLKNLGIAGFSQKMKGDEKRNPIGLPYAGNKGLGILTAFFLAQTVIIETNSIYDKKSYRVEWHRGSQEYNYNEISEIRKGTMVTLKNVDQEKLQMILLEEEKVKIFLASIRYYTNNLNLPKIRLFINGEEEGGYPTSTFDNLYRNNKRSDKGFISKASFRYKENKLFISYEDNISSFYNFNEKEIDLNNINTLDCFIREISAPAVLSGLLKKSELLNESYLSVYLPEFSGCLYTWRGTKIEELDNWPVGVRIYVNNYSLYRYMDPKNDWLTLSLISQNVKATNYKLKNTYGYIDFNDYNENGSYLKISKERNDFVDSLAQRKFIKLMREFVITIFTRIDISTKNPPKESISLRQSQIIGKISRSFDLKQIITCNNVGLDKIMVEYDSQNLTLDSNWILTAQQLGNYDIKFKYKEFELITKLYIKKCIPEFHLEKNEFSISEGNSINLRDFIDKESCVDVNLDDIIIEPRDTKTQLIDDLFSKDNVIGIHCIYFTFEDVQKTLLLSVKEIEKYPGVGKETPRIISLFPRIDELNSKEYKVVELINSISSYYVSAPTLCMAGIRILLESASKAFLQFLSNEVIDISFEGLINKVINIKDCDKSNKDYCNYVLIKDDQFINKFQEISQKYNVRLSKEVKKNIELHLRQINLNMFVHNPQIITTDSTVYGTIKVFEPLLNYIFDILLL